MTDPRNNSNVLNSGGAIAVPAEDVNSLGSFIRFLKGQLKPVGPWLTPFNIVTIPLMVVAAGLIVLRFWKGIGAVSNANQIVAWGIWKGFNVVTGVAFAGGAYVLTFLVYVLKVKKYEPILNATVLNGFLAYCFYAGALFLDLGRPWNIMNPVIGNAFGLSSVLFLIAWHFIIYMICEALEFSPVVAEWLGWPRVRKLLHGLTTGVVILGITLSTLHQSGLGALFLLAPSKIHPLWYSNYIPPLFFVSSVFAGISMVIIESSISKKVFSNRFDPKHPIDHDGIILGLGKGAAGAMFAYLFLKLIDFIHGQQWSLINTPMGIWYLVEVVGFVALPMVLFMQGVSSQNVSLVKKAAVLTAIGVVLNRLNISVIGFKWDLPDRYYPRWEEVVVALSVLSVQIWVFRWIINRMPVMTASHED